MVKANKIITKAKRKLGKDEPYSIQEIMPYKRLEGSDIVKEDDTYMVFMKIKTNNINGLSSDEQNRVMRQLENLNRVYDDELSIISMMFPTNLDDNISFWKKKLFQARQEKNIVRTKVCLEQINRLYWVEKELSNLEFFFILYGKTLNELIQAKQIIKRAGGALLGITDVSPEDTEKVLQKINNMNLYKTERS